MLEDILSKSTAQSPNLDVAKTIGDMFRVPDHRTDLLDWYFDKDISIKTYLIKLQFQRKDPDDFKKFAEKWKIGQDPERWDHFYLPIIFYKLAIPCPLYPDNDSDDSSTQYCVHLVDDDHRDIDIAYAYGMLEGTKTPTISPTPKRFHISSQVYSTVSQFEITIDKTEDFISSIKKPEPPHLLYRECKAYLQKYVDALNYTYTIATLWLMGTHIYRIFYRYPYLEFYAPTGSGKTRYIKSILNLSQRGKLLTNPTIASLYRTVHGKGMTLGLDENEHQHKSEHLNMINYLNATFEKGSSILRCEKRLPGGPWRVEEFDGYCPKIFGTTEPTPATLGNRSLRIPVLRTKNTKFSNMDPDPEYGAELCWRLEKWALSNGTEIYLKNEDKDCYDSVYKDLFLDMKEPRFISIMHPLIIVADSIGLHHMDGEIENIKEFIEYQKSHIDEKRLTSQDRRVILAYYDVLLGKVGKYNMEEVSATPGEIKESLLDQSSNETETYTHKQIGDSIAKFDLVIRKRHLRNGQIYYTTIPQLEDLMELYEVDYTDRYQGD